MMDQEIVSTVTFELDRDITLFQKIRRNNVGMGLQSNVTVTGSRDIYRRQGLAIDQYLV